MPFMQRINFVEGERELQALISVNRPRNAWEGMDMTTASAFSASSVGTLALQLLKTARVFCAVKSYVVTDGI